MIHRLQNIFFLINRYPATYSSTLIDRKTKWIAELRFYFSNVKIDFNVCLSPVFILDRGIDVHSVIIGI